MGNRFFLCPGFPKFCTTYMETNIILTRDCDNAILRQYFGAIYQLSHDGSEFPINLDSVFHLVYGKKSDAVSALKRTFIEGIDYISFFAAANSAPNNGFAAANSSAKNILLPRNEKQTRGGQNRVDYYLSVSCLEFFIARKVRPVFEVYRRIFHKVADQAAEGNVDQLQILSDALSQKNEQIKLLQQENKQLKDKMLLIENHLTHHEHNGNLTSTTQLAKMLGFRETKELILKMDEIGIIIYWGGMMILTPKYDHPDIAEYVTWWKGNRRIEYVGWTEKGIDMVKHELNLA